jgi:signal transduction histidine kinase
MANIAIVEDQKSVREYLKAILAEHHQVSAFESADGLYQFLDTSTVGPVQLVLTDLNLEESDGKAVVLEMNRRDIPTIVITGEQSFEKESEVLAVGAFDYIRKPVNADILLHRVNLHLRLREEQHRVEQTQEQLIQSEKLAALGQLAAGVAHEINNPIGFVTSNANLVSKYVTKLNDAMNQFETDSAAELSGEALLLFTRWKATSKIEKILNDLTELSQESIEGLDRVKEIVKDLKEYAHTGEIKFEPADINKQLTSTVNLLRNEIKYKAEVSMNLSDIPPVPCIVSQINQVFVNIIVNACHAIPEFGNLTISSETDGDFVLVNITDDGTGMPKEIIRKIFDPFFTTKEVGKGTGIGLAITKSIIDRHSGKLDVRSAEGVGTTFSIRLPIEQTGSPES